MKHQFKFAYITPQGGLAGGDDCYICLKCGYQSIAPTTDTEHTVCKGTPIDEDAKKDIATWHRLNPSTNKERIET